MRNTTTSGLRRLGLLGIAVLVTTLICANTGLSLMRYLGCQDENNHDLYYAIAADDLDRVRGLLADGSDPDSRQLCFLNDTPIDEGSAFAMRLEDEPPLIYAIQESTPEIAQVLLEYKANPNLVGESGAPPLMIAIAHADYQVVPMLLEYGADANCRDLNTGETALILAARLNQLENVRVLLRHDAAPEVRNPQGKKALDYATQFDDGMVLDLLQEASQ